MLYNLTQLQHPRWDSQIQSTHVKEMVTKSSQSHDYYVIGWNFTKTTVTTIITNRFIRPRNISSQMKHSVENRNLGVT